MIGQAQIEYFQSSGHSSNLRLIDIWTTTCVSSSGPVLPTTRSDLILWQIPSSITILLSLYKDTHFVVYRWWDTPLHSGISQSESNYWMLSSMSESRSFSDPMRPLEDTMANELVPDNIVEQIVQERKDIEFINQVCFSFIIVYDWPSYRYPIIVKVK